MSDEFNDLNDPFGIERRLAEVAHDELSFPSESYAEPPGPDFVNPTSIDPKRTYPVVGGFMTRETAVSCLHCGVPLGEFKNGQRVMLIHPPLQRGSPDYGLWLMEEDTDQGPEYIQQKIGAWIRTIHPPEENPKVVPLRGETHRFRNVSPDLHIQNMMREVIGDAVKQIAGLMHLLNFPGNHEQYVINLADDCGFRGELVLRTLTECQHDKEQHKDPDREATQQHGGGSDNTNPQHSGSEATPEERLLRAIFGNHLEQSAAEFGKRDASSVDNEGDEPYRHDPGDPSHDD